MRERRPGPLKIHGRHKVAKSALQIGATGGTSMALEKMREVEAGNGGYRFNLRRCGTWPDETRLIGVFCRATARGVVELDFQ